MIVSFVSAKRYTETRTTTQSFTTPATRIVRALVWDITRNTDTFRAKVHSALRTIMTGSKCHCNVASNFGFSRISHGTKRQRALHNRKANKEAGISGIVTRKRLLKMQACFVRDHDFISTLPNTTKLVRLWRDSPVH